MNKTSLRSAQREFVRREHDRSSVALPAIIEMGQEKFGARVINIAEGGALIKCSASFRPGASFSLHCGSIAADASVVWQDGDLFGVGFRSSLSEVELAEQLFRNRAVESRKLLKGQSGAPTNASSTTTAGQRRQKVRSTPSSAHPSAVEASHQRVESCLFALETIVATELSDIVQLSNARLRLRQANVARTAVALEACRHRLTIDPSQAALRDLQRKEIDVSQMISDHVQSWSNQKLQHDWESYCRATRKVLDAVRELITTEKKLLCRTR